MGEEFRESFKRPFTEALALRDEPLLERRFVDAEPFEQITSVKRDGSFERLEGSLGQEPFEADRIHFNGCQIQSNRLAFNEQEWRCGGQCLAKNVYGLSQALSRLLVGRITPEQGGQSVARERLPWL